MKKRDVINIIILLIIISFAAYRFYNRKITFSQSKFALDTIVEITVTSQKRNIKSVIDEAFEMIADYDRKFNFYDPEGELGKINSSEQVSLDKDFYQLLKISFELYEKSDSLYDTTIGRLTELWDFSTEHIPNIDSIRTAQENSGFEKIKFSEDQLIKPKNLKLNFGSLAKGYIIDRVVDFLEDNPVESGIVNAGGDIRIFGYNKKKEIGIQHPRSDRNEIIATLQVGNKAIVTSGDYERFFIKDNKRYHHIIDPKTGFPTENAISVTVVASQAVTADAYSTALFLLKPEAAIELVNQIENLQAIIYFETRGKIESIMSERFEEYLVDE